MLSPLPESVSYFSPNMPGNKVIAGGIGGVSTHTTMQKVWRVSQAVGDVAFAYPYSMIVLEIQVPNTLPIPIFQLRNKSLCLT